MIDDLVSYRVAAAVEDDEGNLDTKTAVVGYNSAIDSFFLQAFESEDGNEPRIWLGTQYCEFPTIGSLKRKCEDLGLQLLGAKHPDWGLPHPSIWEEEI